MKSHCRAGRAICRFGAHWARTLCCVATASPVLNGRAHRRNPLVADGVLVTLVTLLALSTLIYRAFEGTEVPPGAIRFDIANIMATALALAGICSLIWRRPAAMPVLVASGTVFVVFDLVGSASPVLGFAPLMALYAVAATSRPAVSG